LIFVAPGVFGGMIELLFTPRFTPPFGAGAGTGAVPVAAPRVPAVLFAGAFRDWAAGTLLVPVWARSASVAINAAMIIANWIFIYSSLKAQVCAAPIHSVFCFK